MAGSLPCLARLAPHGLLSATKTPNMEAAGFTPAAEPRMEGGGFTPTPGVNARALPG